MSPAAAFALAFLSFLVVSAQCSENCSKKPELESAVQACTGKSDYSPTKNNERCDEMKEKYACALKLKASVENCDIATFVMRYGLYYLYWWIYKFCE